MTALVKELRCLTDRHRAVMDMVCDRQVWWDPRLNVPAPPKTAAERVAVSTIKTSETGGFVWRMGGATRRFPDLSQLITLWELVKCGYVETAPVPVSANPGATHQPRPVLATAAGLAALRGSEDTRK